VLSGEMKNKMLSWKIKYEGDLAVSCTQLIVISKRYFNSAVLLMNEIKVR
jgi:hypothetical protein